MSTLTDKQRAALESIKDAPGRIAIVHLGNLRDMGFVEKAELNDGGGQRGFAAAKITAAGVKALGGTV